MSVDGNWLNIIDSYNCILITIQVWIISYGWIEGSWLIDCQLQMDWQALIDGLLATDGLKGIAWWIVSYGWIKKPWLIDCQLRMD